MNAGIRMLGPMLKVTLEVTLTGQQSSCLSPSPRTLRRLQRPPFSVPTPPKRFPNPSVMTLLMRDGLMKIASYFSDGEIE